MSEGYFKAMTKEEFEETYPYKPEQADLEDYIEELSTEKKKYNSLMDIVDEAYELVNNRIDRDEN